MVIFFLKRFQAKVKRENNGKPGGERLMAQAMDTAFDAATPNKPIKRRSKLRMYIPLYLFLVPSVALTLLFAYLPMFSNVIAFMDYSLFDGFMGLGSPWVGFKNFSFLGEAWFYELAGRTFYYSFFMLLFSFPASMILALLLNELRLQLFKKLVQTISYVPHFVSWVTVAGLFYIFLSYDSTGIVNNIMTALFHEDRKVYMQDESVFLPLLILSQIWKEIGWGSILYLAALTMIDPHLYEAAKVDGANRLQQVWHITLPGIRSTTVILLIFALGGLFSGNFDQIFNFQNQVIQDGTNIINTYTYYVGIREQQFSHATAVGLFQGFISFLLIYTANYSAKKLSGNAIF